MAFLFCLHLPDISGLKTDLSRRLDWKEIQNRKLSWVNTIRNIDRRNGQQKLYAISLWWTVMTNHSNIEDYNSLWRIIHMSSRSRYEGSVSWLWSGQSITFRHKARDKPTTWLISWEILVEVWVNFPGTWPHYHYRDEILFMCNLDWKVLPGELYFGRSQIWKLK